MSVLDKKSKILVYNEIEWVERKVAIEEIKRLNKENKELYEVGARKSRYIDKKDLEIERLNNIIKEVREYIEEHIAVFKNGDMLVDMNIDELLEILDKGVDKE